MLLNASEKSPMKSTRWVKSPAATRCVCQVRWRSAAWSVFSEPARLPLTDSELLQLALRDGEREAVEAGDVIEQPAELGVVCELSGERRATSAAQRRVYRRQRCPERRVVRLGAHAAATSAVNRQVRSPVHQQSTSLTTKRRPV